MSLLSDYHEWRKVADTGLPQNFLGYIIQLCLSPLRADPFTISPYDDPKELARCGNSPGFLGSLPEREGERPHMTRWMAPHRQITQTTGDEMHNLLQEAVDGVVAAHASHVVVRTSLLEKSGEGLLIADDISSPHPTAKSIRREIAHVHKLNGSNDYSLHLSLAPSDCKEVITKKWGERMTLAGTLVPHVYLLIYTPRTKEELEVMKQILQAAVRFMVGWEENENEP